MKVHFIGIGGIGMSALARYFLSYGYEVSGSDIAHSVLTKELQAEGIHIFIGCEQRNIVANLDLVIYSAAVKDTNLELITAREFNLIIKSYAEALGELTRHYTTIAISGSHGKSTTTSLVALTLIKAGFDPTVIVGTKLRELKGSNFRKGKSKYLIIEADEWNKSFHNYFPKIIVLTNIDKEHLDTYKTYTGIVNGFKKYLNRLSADGVVVANWKDIPSRKLTLAIRKKGINVIFYNKNNFRKHPLKIPGSYNQVNAEAVWQLAKHLKIKKTVVDGVLKKFNGTWRRLEKLPVAGRLSYVTVYSDYAHHPTEIKATINGLREAYPHKNIICIFEPHQRDRLHRLFKDFLPVFDNADVVVILPIYAVAGREAEPGEDSFMLAQAINGRRSGTQVFYEEDIPRAMKTIQKFITKETILVFMGAGDIDANARKYLEII